jgi:hypothetical protein
MKKLFEIILKNNLVVQIRSQSLNKFFMRITVYLNFMCSEAFKEIWVNALYYNLFLHKFYIDVLKPLVYHNFRVQILENSLALFASHFQHSISFFYFFLLKRPSSTIFFVQNRWIQTKIDLKKKNELNNKKRCLKINLNIRNIERLSKVKKLYTFINTFKKCKISFDFGKKNYKTVRNREKIVIKYM